MIPQLDGIFLKQQATFGTPETSLTGTEYFPALKGSKIDPVPSYTQIEECSGSMDQMLGVPGVINCNGEISCYMRSLGILTVAPDFGLLAQAAGMSETVTAVTGGNKFIYQPATTFLSKDLTAWQYKGGAGSNGSILIKSGNILGNWKVDIEVGKPAMFSLTGAKGTYVSESYATLLTPTKNRAVYPAALAGTISVNGVAYKLNKATFEGGNVVDQYSDIAQTYGFGAGEIADKKGKFTITFYAEASLAHPAVAGLAGAVESAITILYGAANSKLHFSVGYPQFQDWKYTTIGNLTAFEVSGIMSQNNFVITVNNDLT